MTHSFKPGDILHATWGYSMVINDYYRVVAVTPKTITLEHLHAKHVETTGFLSGWQFPDLERAPQFVTDDTWKGGKKTTTFVRRPKNGFVSGHNSSAHACLWNGKMNSFNHCD